MTAENCTPQKRMKVSELRDALSYDGETGKFTWKINRAGKAVAGSLAGHTDTRGYVQIWVFGKKTYAHRLAWWFVNGVVPEFDIDHINGNPSDNRIANLRNIPHKVNAENKSLASAASKTGWYGVSELPSGNFRAEINSGDAHIRLGVFPTLAEAKASYKTAKLLLHKGFIQDRK